MTYHMAYKTKNYAKEVKKLKGFNGVVKSHYLVMEIYRITKLFPKE